MSSTRDNPSERPALQRLRRELILAGVLLLAGFALLPMAVYAVGQRILGDYNGGLGAFYRDLYTALAAGETGAWLLLASPFLGIELLRLLIIPLFRRRRPATAESEPAKV